MPYLVCDKCNSYYELEDGESVDGYLCTCGNTLKCYEDRESYTKDLKNQDITARNKNVFILWTEQSTGIKLFSVLAVLCVGILVIAGISAASNHGISHQSAIYGGNQSIKSTLIVLYASWCPACNQYEQTLSDSRVQEKIGKDYNFQKIDVDKNKDTALKYSKNGQILLPTTIILDANGNEIKKHEGYMTPDELLELL